MRFAVAPPEFELERVGPAVAEIAVAGHVVAQAWEWLAGGG